MRHLREGEEGRGALAHSPQLQPVASRARPSRTCAVDHVAVGVLPEAQHP